VAQPVRVLLVGGGAREHALAWRLRADYPKTQIIAAPGNPGIAEVATCVPIGAGDIDGLTALARRESVDWTLVGPEAPLEAGIVDAFRAERLAIFGPTRAAALLETSKAFAKTLMLGASVPTARAITCVTVADARRAIDEVVDREGRVVVKASGLAAGKGVIVCRSVDDARDAVASMLEGHAFGDAGASVLVEAFMEGEELSLFVLTDGERMVPLPVSQDHKRLLDGDRGPNTGGMGAYCPVSLVERTPDLVEDVLDRIIAPTLDALRHRGTPFTGLLYVGLMLTAEGPQVVEFNCRFGDPETEAVLPALSTDGSVTALMHAIARGDRLPSGSWPRVGRFAVTTVVAASGYPDTPRLGDLIEIPPASDDVLVFHGGTRRDPDGTLRTSGGRVLAVTGLGSSLEEAQRRSQDVASSIGFHGKQFRSDIGWRELTRSLH
jgi:phosphoribosylamine--glycine ligase